MPLFDCQDCGKTFSNGATIQLENESKNLCEDCAIKFAYIVWIRKSFNSPNPELRSRAIEFMQKDLEAGKLHIDDWLILTGLGPFRYFTTE